MSSPGHVELVQRLKERLAGRRAEGVRSGEVPATEYTQLERFERERRAVFARWPSLVAHESELERTGAGLSVEVAGVPLLVVRGADGQVRALRNACRHRATELISERGSFQRKAFVCRYHGWTYDLTGKLIHAPHAETFCRAEQARGGLGAAHAAVRHGFVWAGLVPFALPETLGPLEDELRSLGAGDWHLYRRSSHEVRGNWKLILDAFLESYHVQRLHKDTLARFFVDGAMEAERVGPHIRAAVARRSLLENGGALPPREVSTPNYVLFPNAVIILHPDYASALLLSPQAVDRTRLVHLMLIPEAPSSDAAERHWAKSFQLIDGAVLAAEDLATVEAMQRGLAAGANDTLLFGELEYPALWLHERVNAELDAREAGGRPGQR